MTQLFKHNHGTHAFSLEDTSSIIIAVWAGAITTVTTSASVGLVATTIHSRMLYKLNAGDSLFLGMDKRMDKN
jgi:hypothetical protein